MSPESLLSKSKVYCFTGRCSFDIIVLIKLLWEKKKMNEWMNHNEIIQTHLENVMPTLSSLCLLNVTSLGTMLGTGNTTVTEYLTSTWIFSPDLLRTVLWTPIMWYAELYHVCLSASLTCTGLHLTHTHGKRNLNTHAHRLHFLHWSILTATLRQTTRSSDWRAVWKVVHDSLHWVTGSRRAPYEIEQVPCLLLLNDSTNTYTHTVFLKSVPLPRINLYLTCHDSCG